MLRSSRPRTSARLSVVGASLALGLAAMGACRSSARDLFGDSTGTFGDSASAGSTGGAPSSGSTGSAASSSAGGAGGGGGAGGAASACGDGFCDGLESVDLCPADCLTECGDGACEGAETAQSCAADCDPPPCAHGLCEAGAALAPGCDPCVDAVCASAAACCSSAWDAPCVAQADALCGAGCCGDGACDGETCDACPADCGACVPPPTCPHSVCVAGGALSEGDCFDPCVAETCAVELSCCQGSPPAWDGDCIATAKATCGADPCVAAVCAQDPTCCSGAFTESCVALSKSLCGAACDCAHPICATGEDLSMTCDPCVAEICSIDAFCCEDTWDDACVNEVSSICGITC